MSDLVPAAFVALLRDRPPHGGVSGAAWLEGLPRLLDTCLAAWELRPDGPGLHGECALVVPVRRGDGTPAVLKLTWPHPEAALEHLALQHWAGRGAVRLLAADPSRWALLLERLDGHHDLQHEPIDEACAVLGDLLGQLRRPPVPQLPRLSELAGEIGRDLAAAPGAVPRRFVERAASLLRDLTGEPGVDASLVHTDLHYENVLAAQRQPWLAIDPKPLAADAAYGVAPALWNRWDEALASGNVRWHLRRRLSLICEHAGIDEDLARGWTIVREARQAVEATRYPDGGPRVTKSVAIIKAMQG